jgi:hypothetical protein
MLPNRRFAATCLAGLLAASLAGCGATSGSTSAETTDSTASSETTSQAVSIGDVQIDNAALLSTTAAGIELTSNDEPVVREAAVVDTSGATKIAFSGSGATVDGTGAQADGSDVTITKAGVYVLSGTSSDGRVVVDADQAEITLVFDGFDLTCADSSPVYVYDAKLVTINLAAGTENKLADGSAYTYGDSYSSEVDEEPNACLYSKDDLLINGAGSLEVTGNANNGITSKDTLEIRDANLTVAAANNGVNGKDSLYIDSATVTVDAAGDALRSTNDSDETLGWVCVTNSTLDLTAGEDGVQAETALAVASSDVAVVAGGGSTCTVAADGSAKGLKAGTTLTLASGTYDIDSADDAVHANGDAGVIAGSYAISSGDDGMHADGVMTVLDGSIDIAESYEGIEGSDIEIAGGTIAVTSSDDGLNAAGGSDSSQAAGPMGGDSFMKPGGMGASGAGDYTMLVTGGTLDVDAGGDGLDSNGSLTIEGGTVCVASTGNADWGLDAETSIEIDGGYVFVASAGNMTESASGDQPSVLIGLSNAQKGTYVEVTAGDASYVVELPIQATSLLVSTPETVSGATVSANAGGSADGAEGFMLLSGATYSGGTDLGSVTVSSGMTSLGSSAGGMGSMGGGQGGMQSDPGAGRDQGQGDGQDSGGTAPSDPGSGMGDSMGTPGSGMGGGMGGRGSGASI